MARKPAKLPTVVGRRRGFSFLIDVISELRKVAWPSKEDATRLTIMVLALAIAMGLILGFIDIGLARLISLVRS